MMTRVKGTQDFLDLTLYQFIIEQTRTHLQRHHFTEIMTPIIEHTELFQRSLGLATDVVSKEMFTIAPKGDNTDLESQICLRPEATASIARAFVENNVLQTPWKVFTQGPMFRYERPQKGRYRQFHQVSIEMVGAQSGANDVHFIALLDRFFHERLKINNYALQLNFLGCPADRIAHREKLKQFLATKGAGIICDLCTERSEKNIMRIFDCKNPTCQALYQEAPHITDTLCAPCAAEWLSIREQLELLSISFVHKPTLVRGLDYYSKIVFEFVSNNLGAQNAFCAGGRYDQLISEVGGKQDQPSIGAAFGIERLMLMLEPIKDSLSLPQQPALHIIMPLSSAQQPVALLLADMMHAHGLTIDLFLDNDSIKSMMRNANKMGAAYCLIIGEEEQQLNQVMIKNMMTGGGERVAQSSVIAYLKK